VTESEYATGVMFKSPAALARLYPALVHQGIQHFGSTDVLRFLGHKTQANGRVHGNHQGEVLSSLKYRPEGLRLCACEGAYIAGWKSPSGRGFTGL
jgi:hypothetical protein